MHVKASEIAKQLNISKATVSLALNDKPGVSEKTRSEVRRCYEQLYNGESYDETINKSRIGAHIIYVIIPDYERFSVRNPELDLGKDVYDAFHQMVKAEGYILKISFINMVKKEIDDMVAICNHDDVAGIILFATELYPKDLKAFKEISHPMVIYDSDLLCGRYSQVLLNNRQGAKLAVDHFVKNGHSNMLYFATTIEIYNHQERRKGFLDSLLLHNIEADNSRIIALGNTIDQIYKNTRKYLEKNRMPTAILMESYHVSIGVIRALRESGIRIPQEISLIGIDEIPNYMTGKLELTTVKIPHAERAVWGMVMLFHEINRLIETKSTLLANCSLISGNSVALK
ncbi:MAG: LacI family DNA-binding transcriptional regulator [Lachnospiraceae bacterium]